MRKLYRISVKFKSENNQRKLMLEAYSSEKAAQEMCDKMNAIDPEREARVIVREEIKCVHCGSEKIKGFLCPGCGSYL